jgi:hypothetical protein
VGLVLLQLLSGARGLGEMVCQSVVVNRPAF